MGLNLVTFNRGVVYDRYLHNTCERMNVLDKF